MPLLTKRKFSFISKGMAKDTFAVVSFKGSEAISKPYEFDIVLVSENTDIDPLLVLKNPAVFTIHRDEEDDVDFNGILMQFEETQEFNDHLFFKAVLVPKLWWLSLTHHNQIFLDKTVDEIMEAALKDGGLAPGIDFEFSLQKTYLPYEYICQYDETHFNFISRWAQREGIYYYFEQTPAGEKVIFTDSKIQHADLPLGKDLIYSPPSGLTSLHTKEVVLSFIGRHNMLPKKIHLKDYNYLKPSMAVEGMADVDEDGRGENYIYGVQFDDPKEGNRLAAIRAEALLCKKSEFTGESSVPFIVPGYTFDLSEHYKGGYNRKYLVTEVVHQGHQTGFLIAGLSNAVAKQEEEMFYANTFSAIYSDKQFRAPHENEKPKVSGTINAKIDAAGSGQYAEIDEYGRYKVILPFDLSGRFGGKASAWFRMMQPYAGENQGMHFPLHKGTEVLLTFIDGNPDRPVIAGAVPNPETSSPVKDQNQTKSIITTGKNTPDSSVGAAEQMGRSGSGTSAAWTTSATDNYIEFEDLTADEHISIHSDGDLWFEAQNRYGEYRTKDLGGNPSPGQSTAGTAPTSVNTLLGNFTTTGTGTAATAPTYAPTGMLDRHNTHASQADFHDNVFKYAHVHVSSLDTVNTQEGNIYDFGGYWNYNLGNCYVEEHLDQSAQLNKTRTKDLLDAGGPYFTAVSWAKAQGTDKGGTKVPDLDDIKIGSGNQWNNSGGSTNLWVNKTFGNSYTYAQGNSIEVTSGDSLEIQHGGKHVEMAFRGTGEIKSWAWQSGAHKKEINWDSKGRKTYDMEYVGGVLDETTWNYFAKKNNTDDLNKLSETTVDKNTGITSVTTYCRDTGNMIAYNSTHQGANSVHSHDFAWANTAKSSFTFAAGAAFSFEMAASLEVSISVAASAKIGIGAALDFKMYWNPSGELKLKNGSFEYHGINSKLDKEAELKAHNQGLVLRNMTMRVQQANVRLGNSNAKLSKYAVELGMGTVLKM